MANLKKVDEYQAFKKMLESIRSGGSPIMVGDDYVVVDRKSWEASIKKIQEYQLARTGVNGRPS